MPIKKILLLIIVGMGLLSLGTVIKKKDKIQDTQTDPVAYEQKMRQEAEGKKGPPAPTFNLFPRENFLEEGPMEKSKPSSVSRGEEESEKNMEKGGQWEWEDTK